MTKNHILIVDDDAEFLERFCVFGADAFQVTVAHSGAAALELVEAVRPDAILLDVSLGSEPDGLDVLRRVRARHPDLPVIMVSGDDRPETVVAAMRAGATDYVSKHPRIELLRIRVQKALDDLAWKTHARDLQEGLGGELIGSGRAMSDLREEIGRVAARDVRVLIVGESGTGKELVARALHRASSRRSERLITFNSASGSEGMIDAELFGHEKGAFTGAEKRKMGRFELANRGTLFLDEIGKMPAAHQAKLLRVLESGCFERVGGVDPVTVDVRVLAATNEDLPGRVEAGKFLKDLYYRLDEYRLEVPPLRRRREDIPELASELLRRFARREAIEVPPLTESGLIALLEHDWPGNVRELDSVLKRVAILAPHEPIHGAAIRKALRNGGSLGNAGIDGVLEPAFSELAGPGYQAGRDSLLAAYDRWSIADALERSAGNATQAAKALGISRASLYRRLNELGISANKSR
ncbi:MAG: sigma-54 dependent transcriptional regulator [Acidobacteriota bacterium]|nr:sigma-54 dependent transcriptional regulator [Acidobacteriota bacterium]MDQ7087733.1 sigma-54 dependent transcriptional regulator [Acidobacteriota bacterium]